MAFDPDERGPGRLRARIDGLKDGAGRDPALAVGVAAGAAWLLLVLLFWLFGSSPEEGGRSGAAWLISLAGIVLPLLLIWLAVGTHRALAGLRDEAHDLRRQLLALRSGSSTEPSVEYRDDPADVPPARSGPAQRTATIAPRARASRAAAAAPRAEAAPQPSLDLGAPASVEVAADDLIAALNFPDGPDDHATIAALRRALTDPETARLIRAAQDVVTLLAARGLYMDDQRPLDVPAASWRRFAEGARGAGLGELHDLPVALTPEGEEMLADALRGDEVFRDAAHHFLRHWDRLFTRTAPVLSDGQLLDLAATRSGRAFATLAQATGIFA